MTSTQLHRTQVLSIYRQLLRLTYDIPKDHIRPKRQFGAELHKHITQSFRDHQKLDINDPKTISLIAESKNQLRAFEAIISNKFLKEFPLSTKLLNPASNPVYYENLVRDLEKVSPDAKPTWKDTLRIFFNLSPR